MRYISPVAFFNEDLAGHQMEITERDILMIKRKLLAETELSDNKTVIRNGTEYSKEDIITLFDKLGRNLRIDYHQRIFDNKPLLGFLESAKFNPPEALVAGNEEREFLDFIQPWFIPVWSAELLTAMRNRNFKHLLFLLEQGKIIFEEFLLMELLSPLEDRLQDFENEAMECWKRIQTSRSWSGYEVDQYINLPLVHFLNALPYTFGSFRNSYMIAMINITVFIYNAGNSRSALDYASTGVRLECDDYYLQQMLERIALYRQKGNTGPTRGNTNTDGNSSVGRVIWFMLIVVSVVVRLRTCNDHYEPSTSTTYTNPYTYYLDSIQGQRHQGLQEDSLIKTFEHRLEAVDTSIDEGRIEYAVLNEGNKRFLKDLVKALQKNTYDLTYKPNLPKENPEMEISELKNLINKDWKGRLETQYQQSKKNRVAIVNRTSEPMVLLYTEGPQLIVATINAGKTKPIVLYSQTALVIPFFGFGWDNSDIYRYISRSEKVLLNHGWFKNRPDEFGTSGHVTLLSGLPQSTLKDSIIFSSTSPGQHYSLSLKGAVK